MDKKDRELTAQQWAIFFQTEGGKKFKEELLKNPFDYQVEDMRKVREELEKYKVDKIPKVSKIFTYTSTSADGWKYHKRNKRKSKR